MTILPIFKFEKLIYATDILYFKQSEINFFVPNLNIECKVLPFTTYYLKYLLNLYNTNLYKW
jgi:hypothetical protein